MKVPNHFEVALNTLDQIIDGDLPLAYLHQFRDDLDDLHLEYREAMSKKNTHLAFAVVYESLNDIGELFHDPMTAIAYKLGGKTVAVYNAHTLKLYGYI